LTISPILIGTADEVIEQGLFCCDALGPLLAQSGHPTRAD
jgi:hypothetical protein